MFGNALKTYIATGHGQGQRTRFQTRNRVASMTMTKKPRRQMGIKSLKRAIKDTEPAKHFTFENNAPLLHNTVLTCVPTQGLIQGTSNIARIGDAAFLCALKVKGEYLTNVTAGAYTVRFIVGWTGEEVTTVGVSSSLVSGLGISEVFLPGTASLFTCNGLINPKTFTCLSDMTMDLNSQIAATSDTGSIEFNVPINQSFYYQSAGSLQGKTRNLAIVVVGCVAGGTTGVTAAGNMVWSADLIFKD